MSKPTKEEMLGFINEEIIAREIRLKNFWTGVPYGAADVEKVIEQIKYEIVLFDAIRKLIEESK